MERNTGDIENDDRSRAPDGETLSSVEAEDARRRAMERLQAEHPERFAGQGRRTEQEEPLEE